MFALRVTLASVRRASRVVLVGRAPPPVVNNRRNFARQLPAASEKQSTIAGDAAEAPSKPADVFGDLGGRRFERAEMDEDEEAEEKFVENEARVPRRYRLTPGGYANLIKEHIQRRDLSAALKVLEMVKENRDEPTAYMYNLLLRAFAVRGDLKKCRSLFAAMKKRGLQCNGATYTSILNACANYHHSPTALEYLTDLRAEFLERNVVLNETHYNAMIKAYGRHNELLEAFRIADEMRDRRLPTGEVTFNSLLCGTISDREAGLRHALSIWHVMVRHRIKPTLTTYNLLLRAIRDTKLGDLRATDLVVDMGSEEHRILVLDGARPDLLSSPPTISPLAIKQVSEFVADQEAETEEFPPGGEMKRSDVGGKASIKETKNSDMRLKESEAIGEFKSEAAMEVATSDLPATVGADSEKKSLTADQERLIKIPLAKIHQKNRLILFGGVTGILERMKKDGVTPDTKTVTLLMELVPKTASAENSIVKLAKSRNIPLDIDFYNMLMKKRSVRGDYEGAKELLDDIQRSGLCPDIITWGVLAMGCKNSSDARDLIDGMNLTGHRLNGVIAGTLIAIACKKIRFGFVLEMMETMSRMNVKADWKIYTILDNFQKEMEQMIKSGKFSRTVNHPAFKSGFSKFNQRYVSWQEEMGRKLDKKKEKKT